MNHVHLLLFACSFNFNWSKEIQRMFTYIKPVASATTFGLSLDCIYNHLDEAYLKDHELMRLFFTKLIFYAFLPLLALIISFGFWSIYYLLKRTSQFPMGRAVGTIVITLFMLHPTLVSHTLLDFRCVDVDGELRLFEDLEILCWSDSHSVMSYYVGIPALIVWGLGIPLVWLIYMIKQKSRSDKIDFRE